MLLTLCLIYLCQSLNPLRFSSSTLGSVAQGIVVWLFGYPSSSLWFSGYPSPNANAIQASDDSSSEGALDLEPLTLIHTSEPASSQPDEEPTLNSDDSDGVLPQHALVPAHVPALVPIQLQIQPEQLDVLGECIAWVATLSGRRYHFRRDCEGLVNARYIANLSYGAMRILYPGHTVCYYCMQWVRALIQQNQHAALHRIFVMQQTNATEPEPHEPEDEYPNDEANL